MVSKLGVRALVVIEDERLERFCREALMILGFHRREMRFFRCPKAKQDAKQWVDAEYAQRVREFRSKNFQSLLVVAGTDADRKSVALRTNSLAKALTENDLDPRSSNEAIIHWIAKRNIETWILRLLGNPIGDEDEDFKPTVEKLSVDMRAVADSFVKEMKRHHAGEEFETLPSLRASYEEAKRLP